MSPNPERQSTSFRSGEFGAVLVVVLCCAMSTSCGQSHTQPVGKVTPPAPQDSDAGSNSVVQDPSAMAAGFEVAPLPEFAGPIQCGSTACRGPAEVCCEHDTGIFECVPRSPRHKLFPQSMFEECGDRVSIQRQCNHSEECPAGQVCCSQDNRSLIRTIVCMPMNEAENLVCDYNEPCVDGTCRTFGTVCVRGRCLPGGNKIRCGSQDCTGTTPVCCDYRGGKSACASSCLVSGIPPAYEVECTERSHCPPGAYCQANVIVGGASCVRLVDHANAKLLCASDADCSQEGCEIVDPTLPVSRCTSTALGRRACECTK